MEPLDYVEVEPIDHHDGLTARFVHQILYDWSQQSLLLKHASRFLLKRNNTHELWIQQQDATHNVAYCPSTNPLVSQPIQVKLYGYILSRRYSRQDDSIQVCVNESTLVRILRTDTEDWKAPWMGALHSTIPTTNVFLDVSLPHTFGTYWIGTTRHTTRQTARASLDMQQHIDDLPIVVFVDASSSPHEILHVMMQQNTVRVLSLGMMRGKYGAYSDWGLASTIHEIAMEWAVRNMSGTIVLVLDSTDARMQQYLEQLNTIQTIPYPEAPLYGMPDGGVRLTVRLRIWAVTSGAMMPHGATIVRVPHTQSMETRLRGLRYALQPAIVEFDDEYIRWIAGTIAWARGTVFDRIRDRIMTVKGTLTKRTFEAILRDFGSMPNESTVQQQAGGNDMAKQALQDALYPEIELESLGLSAPTGILLYGPPGTGT